MGLLGCRMRQAAFAEGRGPVGSMGAVGNVVGNWYVGLRPSKEFVVAPEAKVESGCMSKKGYLLQVSLD